MGKAKIASKSDSGRRVLAQRTQIVTQFIAPGARVLEIGATALRDALPYGCTFEHLARPRQFDFESADVVVALDAIQTEDSGEALLSKLVDSGCALVVNYRPRDFRVNAQGNERLGFYDLSRLFDRFGYSIECTVPLGDGEVVMRLAPAAKLHAPAPYSIAVISDAPKGFAGRQLLHSILPPQANVHELTFANLAQARERYDLVVVGVGEGLSPAIFTTALVDVVKRGAARIGIFGLQDRELVARPALNRLLGALDTWFARNEDDVLLYGRRNAVHLGDWTFDLCAVADGKPFTTVAAADLDDLAFGLAAADVVSYSSGFEAEARSLLLDVFGRGYPSEEAFLVERDAVTRYKVRVRGNIAKLRSRIAALLEHAAVAAAA